MSGRGRMPLRNSYSDRRRGAYPPDAPSGRPYPPPGGAPRPPHPAVYEEELELQMADIRRLSSDNRRLAEDRAALQRELGVAREEIHRLTVAIGDIRAERDAHMRDLIEKGLKLEADLRATEPLRNDAILLRAEVQKLETLRQEQVQGLNKELDRARVEAKQVPALKSEVDSLRQELMHIRSALEYEQKGNTELIDQRQAMEKNLITMAREIEKLRADLGADGRNRGPGVYAGHSQNRQYSGGPYGMNLSSPEGKFPSSYADGYGLNPGVGEKPPLYGAGPTPWSAYEKSRLLRR